MHIFKYPLTSVMYVLPNYTSLWIFNYGGKTECCVAYNFLRDHVSKTHFESSYIIRLILFMGGFSLRALYLSVRGPRPFLLKTLPDQTEPTEKTQNKAVGLLCPCSVNTHMSLCDCSVHAVSTHTCHCVTALCMQCPHTHVTV